MSGTLALSQERLAQFRSQLAAATGAAEYWRDLSSLRLLILAGTVANPEFAAAAFGDEAAALRAWGHDLPAAVDPVAAGRVVRLLLQLAAEEQRGKSIPVFTDGPAALGHLDHPELPTRTAKLADGQAVVIAVRGLNGVGKTTLAEVMARVGFANQPAVALLPADAFLCRVGKDPESKQTAYRVPGGDVVLSDPLQSNDPVGEASQLLWHDEFQRQLRVLEQDHPVIVVEGGYGELMLDEAGFADSQRLVLEVHLDSARRFQRVINRQRQHGGNAAVGPRALHDTVTSFVWYSLLYGERSPPDMIVSPQEGEQGEMLIELRSRLLGRQPGPPGAKSKLLLQLKLACEPGREPISAAELDALLAAIFVHPPQQTVERFLELPLPDAHRLLPADVSGRLSVPQLQLLIGYHRQTKDEREDA